MKRGRRMKRGQEVCFVNTMLIVSDFPYHFRCFPSKIKMPTQNRSFHFPKLFGLSTNTALDWFRFGRSEATGKKREKYIFNRFDKCCVISFCHGCGLLCRTCGSHLRVSCSVEYRVSRVASLPRYSTLIL